MEKSPSPYRLSSGRRTADTGKNEEMLVILAAQNYNSKTAGLSKKTAVLDTASSTFYSKNCLSVLGEVANHMHESATAVKVG